MSLLSLQFLNKALNRFINVGTPWTLAKKPIVSHKDDEEFEGPLTPKWTLGAGAVANTIDSSAGFSTAAELRYSMSQRPSWLMCQPTADGTAYTLAQKGMSAVPTNMIVWARLCLTTRYTATPTGNDHSVGIRLSSTINGVVDSNNNISMFLNETDANEYAIQYSMDIAGVSTALENILTLGQERTSFQYILMQKVNTVWYFYVASEGGNWIYLGTLTYTGTALDRISLIVSNAATTAPGNCLVGYDFVRRIDSAMLLP